MARRRCPPSSSRVSGVMTEPISLEDLLVREIRVARHLHSARNRYPSGPHMYHNGGGWGHTMCGKGGRGTNLLTPHRVFVLQHMLGLFTVASCQAVELPVAGHSTTFGFSNGHNAQSLSLPLYASR